MQRRVVSVVLVAGLLLVLFVSLLSFSNAATGARTFTATLSGWNEVPSVVSKGFGFAKVRISEDEESIEYELVYYDLVNVTAAHIHIGRDGHVGGVAVWLCGGPKPSAHRQELGYREQSHLKTWWQSQPRDSGQEI
jgi:CHRD domain.